MFDTGKEVKTYVNFEKGLGWYLHNKKEYNINPRKKLFRF